MNKTYKKYVLAVVSLFCLLFVFSPFGSTTSQSQEYVVEKYLYVAVPGIRDYLEYGGHGILVFDINNNYKLVKRISTQGLKPDGTPSNVKGVAVSLYTGSIYISTIESLQRIDLLTEKIVWEKKYEGGCDRLSVSPDGKIIYLPSFEKEFWNIIDAESGIVIKQVRTNPGAHNTVYGPDGRQVYLAGLRTSTVGVSNSRDYTMIKQVGPFSNSVRPLTINYSQTLCYVNVNDLLGFEIGDLTTGKKIQHIEVTGFSKGPVKRHGCPSHGIGLTPNERELWLCDGYNQRLHIFDNTSMPPRQLISIALRDQPGWITFSLDGKHAYPSTGEIIDVPSRAIFTELQDEQGNAVMSEKMIEIHFKNEKPIVIGDQFGIGRNSQQ